MPDLPPLPEDPAQVMELASAGLRGPQCAELAADVEQTFGTRLVRTTTTWRFEGHLEDGQWSNTRWTPVDVPDDGVSVSFGMGGQDWPFLPPLFGQLPGGAEGLALETRGLFDQMMGLVESEVSALYVEPDGEQFTLVRRLDKGWFGRLNEARVRFDRATLQPNRWQVQVEVPVDFAVMPGKIRELDAVLETDSAGNPRQESLHAKGNAGPLGLRIDRTLRYTVTPCPDLP